MRSILYDVIVLQFHIGNLVASKNSQTQDVKMLNIDGFCKLKREIEKNKNRTNFVKNKMNMNRRNKKMNILMSNYLFHGFKLEIIVSSPIFM